MFLIPIKHVFPAILALGLLAGCGGEPGKSTGPAPAGSGPVFLLSKARPPARGSADDWCAAPFDQQVIVNAEQVNTNRRYFFLQPGITWLTAERDNARANLLLRPLADGNVEVFTGANFPFCLSRPDYVRTLGENLSVLRYDNGTNIDFNLDVQTEQGRPKVTLEFRPGAFYALNVLFCSM
ncbi:MAG: hypothetical protein ACKVU2_14085 [Saprospiraceae bacterium]